MGKNGDLEIWLMGSDGDEALEVAQSGLMNELREVPGLTVQPISAGPAPQGSKAIDIAAYAILLPAVVPAVDLFKTAIAALRDWVMRQPATTSIKIKVGDDAVEWSGGGEMPVAVTRYLDAATARRGT